MKMPTLRMVTSVAFWLLSMAGFAAVTMLDDGYTEEEWVRTGMSPCTGGSSIRRLTTSGDYVHIYNDTNGVFRAPSDRPVVIHYLLVGGGGGGGAIDGGGGGGGGVVYGSMTLNAGETIMLYPGQGGLGHGMSTSLYYPWITYEGSTVSYTSASGNAAAGKPTLLVRSGDTISAPGGGGGGTFQSSGASVTGAGRGGNGGGHYRAAGGGSQWESGGAASADPNHGGNGADGCGTYIAGEIRYFGGGGGGSCGGSVGTCAGGTGGIGGGGNGRSSSEGYIGDTGVMNTGGGGGGGNHCSYHQGGPGGRGIAIIRYSGAGMTPVVNGCIDRTVDGDVTIGEYTATDGTIGALADGSPAVGGDVVRKLSNGEYVHTFKKDGLFKTPSSEGITVQYLIIGGGGGGGSEWEASGGGAGGVKFGTVYIAAGSTLTVSIGKGGAKGPQGNNGGDTSFTGGGLSVSALGGGGGGAGGWTYSKWGKAGGSSGGAYRTPVDFEQGTCGGYPTGAESGNAALGIPAGGGGAGRMGGRNYTDGNGNTRGGDGGAGVYCAITGVSTPYAGGGAAGPVNGTTYGGLGGSGIGGNGAHWDGVGATKASTPAANTGSGGGGAGGTGRGSDGSYASAGADGVVIFRYYSTAEPAEAGSVFNIDDGVDVADPLANCRGKKATERGRGGAWKRLENGDFLHTFTVGKGKFKSPPGIVSSLRYLIVGGGGPGGVYYGGGGGGGGGVLAGYFPGESGEKFWINVGDGNTAFNNGGDSSITNAAVSFIGKGGGFGGSWGDGRPLYGNSGGSGGGGGASGGAAGLGLTGGCHKGGQTPSSGKAGGGGGACADGGVPVGNKCGNGGDGYNSTITGVAGLYYGGGGGGSYHSGSYTRGDGGKGSVQVPNADGTCYGGGSPGAHQTAAGTRSAPGIVYIRYASAVPTDGPNGIPLGASGVDATRVEDFEIPPIPRQVMNKKTQVFDKSTHTFSPGCEPAVGPFYDDYGDLLTQGVDYSVAYSNNNCAGTGYVVIKGLTQGVVGTNTIPFQISVYNGLIVTFR